MSDTRKSVVCILSSLTLCAGAQAIVADSAANPYQGIVDRNVFGLKPPLPPSKGPDTDKPPPSKITLTGITTIFHDKRALMNVDTARESFRSAPGNEANSDSNIPAAAECGSTRPRRRELRWSNAAELRRIAGLRSFVRSRRLARLRSVARVRWSGLRPPTGSSPAAAIIAGRTDNPPGSESRDCKVFGRPDRETFPPHRTEPHQEHWSKPLASIKGERPVAKHR